MEFTFSDKYEPLFELLEARSNLNEYSVKGLTISQKHELITLQTKYDLTGSKRDKKALDLFRLTGLNERDKDQLLYWLMMSEVDTVLVSGGRDSGKSFALSCFNPIAARDYNHRILYTRQTMSSTDNSITEALENRIDDLGMSGDFTVANKIYSTTEDSEGNPRRGKISITGQKQV